MLVDRLQLARRFFYEAALLPQVAPLAPPSPYLLDSLSFEPLGAYWPGGNLRAADSSAVLRVNRDSDAAELDVYAGANGLVNPQDIINHAGALSTARIIALYDRTTHGKTLTLGTNGPRPKIGNSGHLVADHDSSIPTSLARADSLSLTGNPELWIALQVRGASSGVPFRIGDVGTTMAAIVFNFSGNTIIAQNPGTTRRTFTVTGATGSNYFGLVFQKPVSGDVSTYTLRYNKTDASGTNTNPTNVLNFSDTECRLGAFTVSSSAYNADVGCVLVGTTALSAGELAAIEDWQAYYRV